MCVQEIYCKNKKGFVLLLTLVVMAVLAAIAGSLILTLSGNFRNLSFQANDSKAFWLAEAGIADATKRLNKSEITLADGASTAIPNVSLAGGLYSVDLARQGNDVTLTATGTMNGQTRQVQQIRAISSSFPIAFKYAVFSDNSNDVTLKIGNNSSATVSISGDLFYNANPGVDTVEVQTASAVTQGLVYADTVTGSGTYTKASGNPNPVPTFPSFDRTYYDQVISTADVQASANLDLSGNSVLNLAGQTYYYKSVTIAGSAHVNGTGVIVATKAVTIKDSTVMGSGVYIISKKAITVQDSATTDTNCVLFSLEGITLKSTVNVRGSLITIESGDVVTLQDSTVFAGIIFAYQAKLIDSAVVNGSVVAHRFTNNQIANNVHATFNDSYIPINIPTGFTGNVSYANKANSWREL